MLTPLKSYIRTVATTSLIKILFRGKQITSTEEVITTMQVSFADLPGNYEPVRRLSGFRLRKR